MLLPSTIGLVLVLATVCASSQETSGAVPVTVDSGHCLLKVEAGGGKVLKIRDKEIFNSTDPCMSYTCLAEEETVIAEGSGDLDRKKSIAMVAYLPLGPGYRCVPLEVRGTQCRVEPGREAPFPACCPSPSCDYELGHKDPAAESGV